MLIIDLLPPLSSQDMRKHVMMTLLDTEQSYVESLRTLIQVTYKLTQLRTLMQESTQATNMSPAHMHTKTNTLLWI